MITKFEFNKLFNQEVTNQNLFVLYTPNEIFLNSFYLDGFTCFSICQNRLYINCELDLDFGTNGNFESIDGERKTICVRYDSNIVLLDDIKNLLSWYDSNF